MSRGSRSRPPASPFFSTACGSGHGGSLPLFFYYKTGSEATDIVTGDAVRRCPCARRLPRSACRAASKGTQWSPSSCTRRATLDTNMASWAGLRALIAWPLQGRPALVGIATRVSAVAPWPLDGGTSSGSGAWPLVASAGGAARGGSWTPEGSRTPARPKPRQSIIYLCGE